MTSRRTRVCWCTVGVLVLAVSACGDDGASADREGSAVSANNWILAELEGEPVPDGVQVTLEYDGTTVAGTGGCNQYNGTASFDNGEVDISTEIASTMMACQPPADEVERRYLAALGTADGFFVEDDTLTITSADEPILVFDTA
jgi:putative lipoprotein